MLIAHYPLNGDARDYFGNDGTTSGSASYVDGKISKCLDVVRGLNNHVEIPHNTQLSSSVFGVTATFSFSFWFKARSLNSYGTIISKASGGSWSNTTSGVWTYSGGVRFLLGINTGGNAANSISYIDHQPTLDEWNHYSCISNDVTKEIKMYVNGILYQTNSFSHLLDRSENSAPILIGGSRYKGISEGVDGQIDDFRIYDHALSQKEVSEIASGFAVGYPLKRSGVSTRGEYATITSGSFDETEGVNVSGGSVTIPVAQVPLQLSGETISFRAKCEILRPSVGGGSFSNRIIQWDNYYGTNSGGFGLQSGNVSYYLKGPNSSGWSNTGGMGSANAIYDQGGWIHYAVVFTEDNRFLVYMNGVSVLNILLSDPYSPLQGGVRFGENMQASVSDVRFYSTALSSDQIYKEYVTGLSIDNIGNMHTKQLDQSPRVRYIRDYLNGSTSNSGSHWVEIQANDTDGVNVALNASAYDEAGNSEPYLTDGNTNTNPYASAAAGYVEVDLGGVFLLDNVHIWHYYSDRSEERRVGKECV